MPSMKDEVASLLELASRRVRSAEGARLYGKPIGSLITSGVADPEDGQDRPMAIERVKSLQRQFNVAKRMGNTALMRDIQEEFTKALTEFRQARQDVNLLRELTGARGRNAQAANKDS